MGKFLLLASSIAPSSENLLTFLGISYITGDFNLDLLQSQNNSVTAEFVENIFPFSFFALNKKINAYNSVLCNINRRHIHKQHFNHRQKRTHCYRYFGPFSDIFNFSNECVRSLKDFFVFQRSDASAWVWDIQVQSEEKNSILSCVMPIGVSLIKLKMQTQLTTHF